MKEEKKVEYLELIYDLIFVFIVGRNNLLLQNTEDGFVSPMTFFMYIVCMLAVIQIWNYSTYYINRYGRNGVRDHVFLFINMYLLYYIANGISMSWQSSFYQFVTAWMLILVNLGLQYIIEMRNHREEPWVMTMLREEAAIVFAEAALVGVHTIVYTFTGVPVAYLPVLFGIAATFISGRTKMLVPVDFRHLTERAMLYVVFTFGEMIISIAIYFTNEISAGSIYFSLMAFFIVSGLFLCYEILYNRIIDRDRTTNGTTYMMIHVFLIFALNNISVSLIFMRRAYVDVFSKIVFITVSILLYFFCLFMLSYYSKSDRKFSRGFIARVIVIWASFLLLMVLFRENMYVNIAITVIYVFVTVLLMYRKDGRGDQGKLTGS